MKKRKSRGGWNCRCEVSVSGKKIKGIESIKVEEVGLLVDKTLGLRPVIKLTDIETGKKLKN